MAQTTRRNGGTPAMRESVEQVWLAGLGALALTEEEGSKFFRALVKKGEGIEKRSRAEFSHGVCPDCYRKHLEPHIGPQ